MTRDISELITIEDTRDCDTCERRYAERWELFCTVQVCCLGTALCRECGREYNVIAEKPT